MTTHPSIQSAVSRAVQQSTLGHIPVYYGHGYEMFADEFPYGLEKALAEIDFFVTVDAEGQIILTMCTILILHSSPITLLTSQ